MNLRTGSAVISTVQLHVKVHILTEQQERQRALLYSLFSLFLSYTSILEDVFALLIILCI